MPTVQIWHPDLAELGELNTSILVRNELEDIESEPPAELVFATTGSTQPAVLEFQRAGWESVGTQMNWSRWENGHTRVTVWAKHFPNCAKNAVPDASPWNELRGFCGFSCGVRMRVNCWGANRQLTIVRRPVHKVRAKTLQRLNAAGFRQFAQTRLATYFINGWRDADWSLAMELKFRGLARLTWLRYETRYAYPAMPRPVAA